MSTFTIDFFELAFLADYQKIEFSKKEWDLFPLNNNYIVSKDGYVISLKRDIIRKNGNKQTIHPKLLKPSSDNKGYLYLRISNLGTVKTFKVHQMVAITFLNHSQCGMKIVVDHINNIKTDNRLENLQLISARLNSMKNISPGISKISGVMFSKDKSKWASKIIYNKKSIHLGYFNSKEEAKIYYDNAFNCILNNKPDEMLIKKRTPSSLYKSIFKTSNGKFRSYFIFKGKTYNVGTFNTEIEAYNNYLIKFNNITNGKI